MFLEKFKYFKKKGNYSIYYKKTGKWDEYPIEQQFGKANEMTPEFVNNEIPKRVLGNCCILLCGETNGVKYRRKGKKMWCEDVFGLRAAIYEEAKIVLNPVHDRMTLPAMIEMRKSLSGKNRWLISVWNKGKTLENGKCLDGKDPAWMIFHNQKKIDKIPRIENDYGWDIGILNIV